MIEPYELQQRQSLPLRSKVLFTEVKMRQFIDQCGKDACVMVSGLDSAIALYIARKVCPWIPAVFVDTGKEDPSVVAHAKATDNLIIVKPEITFHEIAMTCGIPAISKDVSRALSDIQNPTNRNAATINLRLTGIKKDGGKGKSGSYLPKKYHRLIDCGFKFSDKCCYYLKHKPALKIQKQMGYAPIIGTLAEDSSKRTRAYLKTGCNNFTGKDVLSKPLSIWTRQDCYRFIIQENIKIPDCYGDIVERGGLLETTGETHTGCSDCLFGIFHDPTRIERMRYTQPARYKYCMDVLNYRELLPILFGFKTFRQFEVFLNSATKQEVIDYVE